MHKYFVALFSLSLISGYYLWAQKTPTSSMTEQTLSLKKKNVAPSNKPHKSKNIKLHLPIKKANASKAQVNVLPEITAQKLAKPPKNTRMVRIPQSLQNIDEIEDIVLNRVDVIDKVDWSQVDTRRDNNGYDSQTLELSDQQTMIRSKDPELDSLSELILNKPLKESVSRFQMEVNGAHEVSYSVNVFQGEGHSLRYIDGQLDSTMHYHENYFYQIRYNENREPIECLKQELSYPDSETILYGNTHSCSGSIHL